MATKKKTKKQTSKPKKSAIKRAPVKAAKPPKKSIKKGVFPTRAKKRSAKKKKALVKKQIQKRTERSGAAAFLRQGQGSRSGEQSGDLQGLYGRSESADSQSVDELLDEGNAFEADAVLGVENADLADEKEVRTHQVPEDDVPEEYLDKE
jgi:hypothetical protein